MKTLLILSSLLVFIPPLQSQETPVVEFVYEVFSMDRMEAAATQRSLLRDPEFYASLVAGLKDGKVRQEKLLAIRGRTGEKAMTEHISELLYPTEYDPPELPNGLGVAADAPAFQKEEPPMEEVIDALKSGPGWFQGPFPATPATPTGYDMRNLGDTLEVESSMANADGETIQIRCFADHVELLGMETWGQGLSEAEMPVIAVSAVRSTCQVTLGVPTLLGTVSLHGAVVGKADGDEKGNRVCFAFLTTSIVEPGK
jgi:hypothetical protein